MRRWIRYCLVLFAALQACSLGPDYQRPDVEVPPVYKEDTLLWTTAKPAADVPKGDPWALFNDPVLNRLQQQARENNQNAKAAYARAEEAQALADVSRSAFFPVVTLDASGTRSQLSATRPLPPPEAPSRFVSNDYSLSGNLSFDLDIWGRLGRLAESAEAQAHAQQAMYENTLLALQANVAQHYYTVRAYDAEIAALGDAESLRQNELDLVYKRYLGKIASALDVSQAQTQLLTARSNLVSTQRARSESEHALAVLLGQPSTSFSLPASPLSEASPPIVPAGLPSQLLERRPDISAAEQEVVARNAEIGAAIGAFFPDISLTGSAGFESSQLHNLMTPQSEIWSIMPGLSQPIFNAGLNEAQLQQARAAYRESVALYRQQILTSFQQVEDALSDLRLLSQQHDVQAQTVQAADTTLRLSQVRYRTGVDTYLNVADAEVNALQSQLTLIDIQRERVLASAAMIQALGGGW